MEEYGWRLNGHNCQTVVGILESILRDQLQQMSAGHTGHTRTPCHLLMGGGVFSRFKKEVIEVNAINVKIVIHVNSTYTGSLTIQRPSF